MRKIIILCLFAFAAASVQAQKTVYDANVEMRPVEAFKAIEVSSGIDLYVSFGKTALAVSAKDADSRNAIKTSVENGVLKIGYDWKERRGNTIGGNRQLKAYVGFETLEAIDASGGSNVFVEGFIQSLKLVINASGGSDFKGKVAVQNLVVDISGGSDVVISGEAALANIDASGGSDFKGFGLQCQTAEIKVSGGSDIEVSVSQALVAKASGGSDVRFKGTASVVETKTSGSSSVKRAGR